MTTAEKIKVMQAFEDGKQIQYMRIENDFWRDCFNPIWNWDLCEYRIKPEPKNLTYRPYKDTDEMIADFEERFRVNYPPYAMPLIWVQRKNTAYHISHLITAFRPTSVFTGSGKSIGLKELFDAFTYFDGSPVGKLVE